MHGPLARTISFLVCVLLASAGAPAQGTPDPPARYTSRQFDQLRRKAEMGYEQQQIELASAYLTGRGVPRNLVLAAKWYEKAAGAGNVLAQSQIAIFYEYGIGVRADLARAFHWYQLASASGLAAAKVNLGVCYLKGIGTPPRPATARALFLQAAKKGYGAGAAFLGMMDYFGMGGTPVDKTAAKKWFLLGTRLNDPMAGFQLAYLYGKDEAPSPDLRKIFELLRNAAKQGRMDAKHCLGLLLLKYPEMAQSRQEAQLLLEESSAAGKWRSSVSLAILALHGETTAPDPTRAYYYFYLARLQGGPTAGRMVEPELARLRQTLSKAEQRSIEARADDSFRHRIAGVLVIADGSSEANFPLVVGVNPGHPE